MAIQSPYDQITRELMGGLPGQPSLASLNGMAAQPTAMIQPPAITSQALGFGSEEEGALTSRFASRQGSSLGSIEPRPIDSQLAATEHDDGHGAVSHPKAKSKPKEEKLGFWKGAKAFALGVISPITGIFTNGWGNFFKSAAVIVGAGLLVFATGGLALYPMIALGAAMGTYQVGKGVYDYSNATTAEEKYNAVHMMGAGAGCIAGSVYGANRLPGALPTRGQGFLGNAGNAARNVGRAFTESPRAIRESATMMTNGVARENLTYAYNNAANAMGVFRGLGEQGRPPAGAAPTGFQNTSTPPGPRPGFFDRKAAEFQRAENGARDAYNNLANDATRNRWNQYWNEYQSFREGRTTTPPTEPRWLNNNPNLRGDNMYRIRSFNRGIDFLQNAEPMFRGQFPNMLGINESSDPFFTDITA